MWILQGIFLQSERVFACPSLVGTALFGYTVLCAGNLARAQATGANRHGGGGPVNNCLHLADVGLPRTVGFTVGVRNVLTEHNALTAYTALCHT